MLKTELWPSAKAVYTFNEELISPALLLGIFVVVADMTSYLVSYSFSCQHTNLEVMGKREPQLKSCLSRIGHICEALFLSTD